LAVSTDLQTPKRQEEFPMAHRLAVLVVAGGCLMVLASACGSSPGGTGGQCSISAVGLSAAATTVSPNLATTLTATVNQAAGSSGCTGGVTWSVTPTGGTLTPSGLTATFSASTAGTYTVKATSTDDSIKFGTVQVTVAGSSSCGTANGTVVTHSTDVTADETWAGNGTTHSVTASITVRAPATLTIAPCAIVSLAAGVGINVSGDTAGNRPARLLAAGTDDATGFVSFVPAVAAQPWGFLQGYNQQSFIELHHTGLVSAGAVGNFSHYAAIHVSGPGNYVLPVPVLTVDHVVVQNPVGSGVVLDSNAAFTPQSTILGVDGATDYPIVMNMMALGSVPLYQGQNNTHDDLLVNGATADVYGDLTITNHIPVRIASGEVNVNPAHVNSALTMVTLTVQAGAEIRFAKPVPNQSGARVSFGSTGGGAQNTIGQLIAIGDTAPILFTSGEATKAPGDWVGLVLSTAGNSQLTNVTIEYAGATSGIVSANCRPTGDPDNAALIIGSDGYVPAAGLLLGCTLAHSAGFGIDAIWATPTDYKSLDLSGGNTFTDNAFCAQSYNGVTATSCPTGGGCTAQ
jgi:hypothetical protein